LTGALAAPNARSLARRDSGFTARTVGLALRGGSGNPGLEPANIRGTAGSARRRQLSSAGGRRVGATGTLRSGASRRKNPGRVHDVRRAGAAPRKPVGSGGAV